MLETLLKEESPQLMVGIFMEEVEGKPKVELKVHKGIQPLQAVQLLQESALSLLTQMKEEVIQRPNFLQSLRNNLKGNGRL